jgi:hypothetical protein
MSHPFERLSATSRARLFVGLSTASLVLFAVLFWIDGELGARLAADLTGDADAAKKLVKAWRAEGKTTWAWASLLVDFAFVPFYTSLVALACVWAASIHVARPRVRRLGIGLAWAQWLGGLADVAENILLVLLLRFLSTSESPPPPSVLKVLSVCTWVKWTSLFAGVGYVAFASRFFSYFAALRPSFVFGLLIAGLPLAALPGAPLGSMVGNLFADYRFFSEAFWFGAVLFGAAWALMLTAGLALDIERKRPSPAVPDPATETPARKRFLTIPLERVSAFALFTLLAAPGAVAVVASAIRPWLVAAYVSLGGFCMYLGIDFTISALRLGDERLRIVPWTPFFYGLAERVCGDSLLRRLGAPERALAALLAWAGRKVGLPSHFFVDRDPSKPLHGDQVFTVATASFVFVVYLFLYYTLLPGGWLHAYLDDLPPAGFLYLLLISLVLVVSALWIPLHRYRMALYAFAAWFLAVNALQSSGPVGGSWWRGNPVHTYDVYRLDRAEDEVTGREVLEALLREPPAPDGGRTLIVAAASGGGILAAGWTTKVLGELHRAYPPLRRELRLISAVSGGSVGTVHYVRRLEGDDSGPRQLTEDELREVIDHSVETSLAATAFGFTFPDFHRLFLPFAVPETDRARLQEERWRNVAGPAPGSEPCRIRPCDKELLSRWSADIRDGVRPAVILNATVLESGERVAITPLASLQQMDPTDPAPDWRGWQPADDEDLVPNRRNGARTLSEFLLAEARRDLGYTIEVWTAARLSATFSYVSPPARARLVCRPDDDACSQEELSKLFASLHLIDGGYHENFGVASALDWITRAVRWCTAEGNCPFNRVALVEIRAKPVTKVGDAAKEWLAAWLGPAVGLLNSWGFAQTSANDTSVDRLIRQMHEWKMPFESFVFVPEARSERTPTAESPCGKRSCCPGCPSGVDEYPLSWHLSQKQKDAIYEFWLDPRNQCTLRAFLRFAHCGDAERSCPAAEKEAGDPCGKKFEAVPKEKRA